MKRKLFILPDGSKIGRWHDSMVHAGARPTKVLRVSNVEWDHKVQQWAARVSTFTMFAPTHAHALELEGELIDKLLEDVVACWRPEGGFQCPKCHSQVIPVETLGCAKCGHLFKNHIEGLKLNDLPFVELLTA